AVLEAGEKTQPLFGVEALHEVPRRLSHGAEDPLQVSQDDLHVAVGEGRRDHAGYLLVLRALVTVAKRKGVIGKMGSGARRVEPFEYGFQLHVWVSFGHCLRKQAGTVNGSGAGPKGT